MKITTVVPFSAQAPSADEVKAHCRTAAPATVMDPAELVANAAALELERRRIKEDSEALQLREENLREYEARLRAMQSEMDTGRGGQAARSTAPFGGRSIAPFSHEDAGLDAAWQKLHRARELTEAEQAHLRDDRLSMRAIEADLKQREAALEAREARVAAQVELLAAATPPLPKRSESKAREPIAGQQTLSAFTRLTRAPFMIAESLRGRSEKGSEKAPE
ncbi:MAG: hypothetical protein ABIZ81_08350 [Opitutaceae bacterium]